LQETDKEFLRNIITEARFGSMEDIDMTVKLNGVILRQAEMDGDFDKVYSRIFEKMVEMEAMGCEDVTDILGMKGG
jgi:hypothetical protein